MSAPQPSLSWHEINSSYTLLTKEELESARKCASGCFLTKLQQQFSRFLIPCLMLSIVVCGSVDVIAGKIRAEPLGQYDGFVTAMLNSVVYFLMYNGIFLFRYRFGRIDISEVRFVWKKQPQFALPLWSYFAVAGLCDVLAQVLQFMAQPYLSVIVFQLMLQAQVPFTVLWSTVFLGSRYILTEFFGVLIVVMGSATAVASVMSSTAPAPTEEGGSETTVFWNSVLVVVSASCTALSFVLKERVFKLAESCDNAVDIFVVNSGCAFFTLLWSTPVSLIIEGLRHPEVSPFTRLQDGFSCMFGGCEYALTTYAVYMSLNILFNLSVYGLVAVHSALLTFVCMKLTTPCAAILSVFDWPLIGSSVPNYAEWFSLVIILAGVAVFRYGNIRREKRLLKAVVSPDLEEPLLGRQRTVDAAPILTWDAEAGAQKGHVCCLCGTHHRSIHGCHDEPLVQWKQHVVLTGPGCVDITNDCCATVRGHPPLHSQIVLQSVFSLDNNTHTLMKSCKVPEPVSASCPIDGDETCINDRESSDPEIVQVLPTPKQANSYLRLKPSLASQKDLN